MRQRFFFLFVLAAVLVSCSGDKVKYRIGISQCSNDIWRDKQNAELRMGTYFHDNVELKFAAAYDSDERQVEQIDSLVNNGIDLLIVAPNQVQTISPAIDRAYDKGIPVIVFERKTNSQKYTAFISADNYEMGRVMGEYIVSRLHGQGTVLEIKGLEGSSPAIERHNGFMDAVNKAPGIEVVASLQGDWTEPTAYETTQQWLANNKDVHVDLVFGANDRTAMGARNALGKDVLYCGIDGLPGENGGIQLVRDSLLDASYIYPTHGDQIIDLAIRILDGKPYDKETMLMSALVTRDNAKVLLMENEEIMRQTVQLDSLHKKADTYLHKLDTQRIINWLALGIIVLLVVVFVLFYLYHLRKIALQRERVVNTLWNLKPEEVPVASEPTATPDESDSSEASDNTYDNEPVAVSHFIASFKEVIEARLDDSNVSVEDLAADMNLSRVQLYRKVKAVTGSSPVELLRTARLNRAYQLLLTTDKSVSEVAYAVGFTAPSYFTKCFKEEYGMVPGDVRK
ncbi:MAG: substrate-binding domain-containing protein [Bacteroidaceae bacterium]|nr:substrate-binding domain-containing protein [Prevotella sp.]MBP3244700.1 substrate-binding domain-containing protein [Bacteroidaceae bacterium]